MPGKNQMTSVFAQPSPRFRVSSPEQRAGKATHEAGYKPAIEAADAPATRAVQFCSEWVRGRAKRVYLVGEVA